MVSKKAKERLKNVHGETVTIDELTYRGIAHKCKFVDKEYGEWWTTAYLVTNKGANHPKRSKKVESAKRTLSINVVKKRLFEIYGNDVSIDESTYINTQIKCRFIDKDYGEWWTRPHSILRDKGKHPKRRHKCNIISIEEIKERIKQIHGDNVTIDESTYISCNKKAKFIDKDYGEWWTFVYNVVNQKAGNPSRSYLKKSQKAKLTIEEVKERIKKVHGNSITIDESTYISCGKKAKFFGLHCNFPIISSYVGLRKITIPIICEKCRKEFMKKFIEWFRAGLNE
jgi:hypothetical protein